MISLSPFAAGLAAIVLGVSQALAQATPSTPEPGRPANLCEELIAFVRKPDEKKQEAATTAGQATSVSGASNQVGNKPSQTGGDAKPASAGAVSSPKSTSGSDLRAMLAQANAVARSAPPPGAPDPGPKPNPDLIAGLETAAAADDQAACRSAARAFRKAGIVMPGPLLALAALDPKFYAGPRSQARD